MFTSLKLRTTRFCSSKRRGFFSAQGPLENDEQLPPQAINVSSFESDMSMYDAQELIALKSVLERQHFLEEQDALHKRKLKQELQKLEDDVEKHRQQCESRLSNRCKICFRVKVSSAVSLVCQVCGETVCTRCGSHDKTWRCILCKKRQEYLTSTGEWYHGMEAQQLGLPEMMAKITDMESQGREMRKTPPKEEILSPVPHDEDSHPGGDYPVRGTDTEDTSPVCDQESNLTNTAPEYLNLPLQESVEANCAWGCSSLLVHSMPVCSSSICEKSPCSLLGDWPLLQETDQAGDDSNERPISIHIEPPTPLPKMTKRRFFEEPHERPQIERVILKRDSSFSTYDRTGLAFGLRVVGGLVTFGGVMRACVKMTVAGKPAENCVSKGDQLLEWNHLSLCDATFEETQRIISSSPDEVSVIVCHNAHEMSGANYHLSTNRCLQNVIEERISRAESRFYCSRNELSLYLYPPLAPIESNIKNRKQDATESFIPKVQLQLWYDQAGSNLIIKILKCFYLPLRMVNSWELPNPYAMIHLLPDRSISGMFRTPTKFLSSSPKWNMTFIYTNILAQHLSERELEVTIWSENKGPCHTFLGEALISLTCDVLCNEPMWHTLKEHNPESHSLPVPMPRRHSISSLPESFDSSTDHVDEIGTTWNTDTKVKKHSNPYDLAFHRSLTNLEPRSYENQDEADVAMAHRKCRRTSSALFIEEYSRLRSRTMSPQRTTPLLSADVVPAANLFGFELRRRSRSTTDADSGCTNLEPSKHLFDHITNSCSVSNSSSVGKNQKSGAVAELKGCSDGARDVSKSLQESQAASKIVKSKSTFGSSSLRIRSNQTSAPLESGLVRSASVKVQHSGEKTRGHLLIERRKQERSASDTISSLGNDPELGTMGPGQMIRGDGEELGYIRLGLVISRGVLDIDVIRAVGLERPGGASPDTYVKTYLVLGKRKFLKRKTTIFRNNASPVYSCNIKYPARDMDNKILHITVWIKQRVFGRKILLGEVHVALASLDLTHKQVSWYKLFVAKTSSDK